MNKRSDHAPNVAPGLIVSAPASASGKTTVTLGLLRALRRRGLAIRSFKVGPDYIDPAYHAAASGRPCVNLDTWTMGRGQISALVAPETVGGGEPLFLAEGALGLFDGAIGVDDFYQDGSAASLSALTGWPVVLVIPAKGMGASIAALVRGFCDHRADVRIAGIILNKVGSSTHASLLRRAIEEVFPDMPVVGAVPNSADVLLPERHLGLIQARELPDLECFLEKAADLIEENVDIDRLLPLADGKSHLGREVRRVLLPPPGQKIAMARDDAFAFSYPALIENWRSMGSEVTFFSPLRNEAPASDCDFIYLPGGYPELHAATIANSCRFMKALHKAAGDGTPVFGECGGYMVLGEGLIDSDGVRHPMAGLLGFLSDFSHRKCTLGYRQVSSLYKTPFGPQGTVFRGHEFHYSTITGTGADVPLFSCSTASGRDIGTAGHVRGCVFGSFFHLVAQRTL